MTSWERMVSGTLWGTAGGVVSLTFLTLLYFRLFDPDALKDGQFSLHIYLFPAPFGAMLGGVAGLTRVLLDLHAQVTAAWVCLGAGSFIAMLAILYPALLGLSGKSPLALAHPACGCPLVWAMAEVIYGAVILRKP
jgi:hypothetical protein